MLGEERWRDLYGLNLREAFTVIIYDRRIISVIYINAV